MKTSTLHPSSPATAPETAAVIRDYRKRTALRIAILAALAMGTVAAFVLSNMVGAMSLSGGEVLEAILHPGQAPGQVATVVWELRLPLATMAVLVGAALGLGGMEMQTILANPLAEPFTLGISAAAAFGAALAVVTSVFIVPGSSDLSLALAAWLMSMLACLAIGAVSLWRGASAETMILLGIAFVFIFQALLSLMQYRATTESLQQIVFWTMGSLTRATWGANALIGLALLLTVPVFVRYSWALTAFRLGEDRAMSLGIRVNRLRVISLACISLLAATAVAFSGVIGFVGLVGPHVARMLLGEDQRFLIPGAMLCGALLLILAHTVSLVVVPGVVLPVGILTALVGVPFFVVMILTRRRNVWGA